MAISTNDSVLALLKVYYKDGVENLLFRNSPLLKKIKKERVEGKSQNFSAIYGRGGAVGGSFTFAKNKAANGTKNAEFSVTPGQVFSVYSMNSKEVQASLTKRGAYMKVAGNKMFGATEGLRKTLGAAMYGRGFGELAVLTLDSSTSIATTGTDITLPDDAIIKIDVGSSLDFKTSIAGSTVTGTATVNSINGNTVNVSAETAAFTIATGAVVCLSGSMDSGNPLLPIGLDGWLPAVANRSGDTWTTYIANSFFGVQRNIAADRLAGVFVLGASSEKYNVTVQKLLRKVRRQGSLADMIVLNDEDFLTLSQEIEATNTYFTQTSTKAKKSAAVGFDSFAASFSTNYIENIIDDPYCPKGKFYILSSDSVEMWSYTNTEKINDGVAENNPGKADPMAMDNDGNENKPNQLMIEDYLNIQSGSGSIDGPDVVVTLQMFGSFVVTNPSVCGVGIFDNGTGFIGYTA